MVSGAVTSVSLRVAPLSAESMVSACCGSGMETMFGILRGPGSLWGLQQSRRHGRARSCSWACQCLVPYVHYVQGRWKQSDLCVQIVPVFTVVNSVEILEILTLT